MLLFMLDCQLKLSKFHQSLQSKQSPGYDRGLKGCNTPNDRLRLSSIVMRSRLALIIMAKFRLLHYAISHYRKTNRVSQVFGNDNRCRFIKNDDSCRIQFSWPSRDEYRQRFLCISITFIYLCYFRNCVPFEQNSCKAFGRMFRVSRLRSFESLDIV